MSMTIIIIGDDGAEHYADYTATGLQDFATAASKPETRELWRLFLHGESIDLPAIKADLAKLITATTGQVQHSAKLLMQAITEYGQDEAPAIIVSNGEANDGTLQEDEEEFDHKDPEFWDELEDELFGETSANADQ